MKGKVESFQTALTSKTLRYEVSLIITIKKGLSYERSQELLDQLTQEYMGKMVEIEAIPTSPT